MIADSDTPDTQKRLDRERLDAMAGFAESPICRRAVLLGYFGEEHPGSCGKCDRCLAQAARVDGTSDLRQAIATVLDTGSSSGANPLLDALLGRASETTRKIGNAYGWARTGQYCD